MRARAVTYASTGSNTREYEWQCLQVRVVILAGKSEYLRGRVVTLASS